MPVAEDWQEAEAERAATAVRENAAFWDRMAALRAEIAAKWQSDKTGVELLEEHAAVSHVMSLPLSLTPASYRGRCSAATNPFMPTPISCIETLAAHGRVRAIVPSDRPLPKIAAALARGAGDPERWHARQSAAVYGTASGRPHRTPVDEALGALAAEIAAEQRIRGCDAVYVALAYAEQAVLITLDDQQRERAPSSVTARTPAQALAEWFQP